MSTITVYLLLSLSVLYTINGQGQSCLDGFLSVTDNTCTSSSCSFQGETINTRQLRLFPSMRITCNGTLERLSVAGETRNEGSNNYPFLQIWRPTSPTSYQRISEYEIPISGCTERPNNVWQCTVSPSINVEEGDIIGINLPRNRIRNSAFGIYFTSPSSFTSYILGSTSDTTFPLPGSTTASVQPVLTLDIHEQVTVTPTAEPITQAPTTELTTQAPTTELTPPAPVTDPTQALTTQSETERQTTQSTTQGPTTHQTTTVGTGQSTSDTEIAGPVAGAVVGGVAGGVVGVLLLVLIVALMVGFVVYILTRRRLTVKGKPGVVSERQVVEDSQRGGISNGIHSTETDYEVIELDSKKQTTEMMSSNPSYMPNTDASINYEDDMYSYIDPEDVRVLARNPIKTDQVPTADNVAYGSAIPQDHSDQVPTADNVAYGSTVR